MKKILLLFVILFATKSFSQEIKYKEYSYSQFLELMIQETDTVFKLKDAIVKYDSITDKAFLVPMYFRAHTFKTIGNKEKLIINKAVELENVNFLPFENFQKEITSSLHSIIFEKDVTIYNSFELNLSNSEFRSKFEFVNHDYNKFRLLKKMYPSVAGNDYIYKSRFSGSIRLIISSTSNTTEVNRNFGLQIGENIFDEKSYNTFIAVFGLEYVSFSRNTFSSLSPYHIQIEEVNQSNIENNLFNKGLPQFYCIEIEELIFKDNQFNIPSLINFKATNNVNFIGANQFNSTLSSLDGFRDFVSRLDIKDASKSYWDLNTIEIFKNYENIDKIKNQTSYQFELDQKSVFYNYFKERHSTAEANKFYIQIKELERKRTEYEHNLNPTFKTFFKLQIGKFLKVFSAYGTEPERAVIVSIYVILLFALIYLLFPNSWDSHGRKRLMHRFEFFQKYLRRKEGMHAIYLEDKQEEISSYEDFKTNLENSKTELPSFFISWSKPLYNASMFSSKLTAKFLQNTDILKGKWQDLSPKQKRWKNIQIGFLLLLGLLYDLFIKALNALMLSINTFTTLGFGEIPIKGLPRYLAIIQGFIGWFMLTIFSVSLISQLLN